MKRISLIVSCFVLLLTSSQLEGQSILVQKVTMYKPHTVDDWVNTKPDPATNVGAYACGASTDPAPIDPKASTGKVLVYSRGPAGNISKLPAVYVSGCKAKVGAEFLDPEGQCASGGTVYVKGVATVNINGTEYKYELPSKSLSSEGKYPITEFKQNFPKNMVQCNEQFNIQWFYTLSPEAKNNPNSSSITWIEAGISDCFVMVTYNRPIATILGRGSEELTTFFLTSIFLSCKAAHGLKTDVCDDVITVVFDEFRDQKVSKYGSSAFLQYWGNTNPLDESVAPICRSIAGLLAYRDAPCGEWAAFYQDIMKVQGIKTGRITTIYWQEKSTTGASIGLLNTATEAALMADIAATFGVTTEPPIFYPKRVEGKLPAYFFVKEHNFSAGARRFYVYNREHRPCTSPPIFTPEFTTPLGIVLTASNSIGNGLPSQGQDDPRSLFENHSLLRFKCVDKGMVKTYGLDPSYGTPVSSGEVFTTQEAYEDASISGFGTFISFEVGPDNFRNILWVYELNTSGLQLNFTPTE